MTTFVPGCGTPPALSLPNLTLKRASPAAAGSECIDYGDLSHLPQDLADLDEDGDTSELIPFDLLESNRRVNRHGFDEDLPAGVDHLDRGCYERP
jgi:hypothetical protein